MKNIVKYKNTFEVKMIGVLALGVIIASVAAIITGINNKGKFSPEMLLWLIPILGVIFIFVIMVRYKTVFDFDKREILVTPYFKKTKKYSFDEVSMEIGKYEIDERYADKYGDIKIIKFLDKDNQVLFKFSDNQFEVKAKTKLEVLINSFGDEKEKLVQHLYNEIKQKDCFVTLSSYHEAKNMLIINAQDVNVYIGMNENNKLAMKIDDANEQDKNLDTKEYEELNEDSVNDIIITLGNYIHNQETVQ